MPFWSYYYNSTWKETPVCQALCGCLSDIEFMSKAGKASSGQRERRGWEQERLAQSEEEMWDSRSQGPKGMKLRWRVMSQREIWGLEQTAVKDWIWPVKTAKSSDVWLSCSCSCSACACLLWAPSCLSLPKGHAAQGRWWWDMGESRGEGNTVKTQPPWEVRDHLPEKLWIQPLKGGRWLFRAPDSLLLLFWLLSIF